MEKSKKNLTPAQIEPLIESILFELKETTKATSKLRISLSAHQKSLSMEEFDSNEIFTSLVEIKNKLREFKYLCF